MLNIAICDDDGSFAGSLEELLYAWEKLMD